MSTIAEIESAIETLPPEKVEAVFVWLQTHKEKMQSAVTKGGFPLFGLLEGQIKYHEGWDEPLEDFKEYTE